MTQSRLCVCDCVCVCVCVRPYSPICLFARRSSNWCVCVCVCVCWCVCVFVCVVCGSERERSSLFNQPIQIWGWRWNKIDRREREVERERGREGGKERREKSSLFTMTRTRSEFCIYWRDFATLYSYMHSCVRVCWPHQKSADNLADFECLPDLRISKLEFVPSAWHISLYGHNTPWKICQVYDEMEFYLASDYIINGTDANFIFFKFMLCCLAHNFVKLDSIWSIDLWSNDGCECIFKFSNFWIFLQISLAILLDVVTHNTLDFIFPEKIIENSKLINL